MTKQRRSKHDPTKTSKQVRRTKKKNNNDWRHIPFIPEMIDQIHWHNPEDDMIAAIDGDLMDEPYSFDAHEVISENLSGIHKTVFELRIIDELTFQQIGDHLGSSRQWAHEVYRQALEIIKKKVNKDGTLKTTSRIEMNMTMRKK